LPCTGKAGGFERSLGVDPGDKTVPTLAPADLELNSLAGTISPGHRYGQAPGSREKMMP